VVVEVSRQGTLRIDGRACSFDGYCELLRQRAASLPTTRAGGYPVSDLNLLFDADRELPCAAIWRLLPGSAVARDLFVRR
jgi:hypothetical protein